LPRTAKSGASSEERARLRREIEIEEIDAQLRDLLATIPCASQSKH
jgi:hypothetical protein